MYRLLRPAQYSSVKRNLQNDFANISHDSTLNRTSTLKRKHENDTKL